VPQPIPEPGLFETVATAADLALPTLAKGAIIRRRFWVGLAERLALDARGVRRMQRLRVRYGEGPIVLNLAGRLQAVLLAPADVRRALDETPAVFSAASGEKRAALAHFEPKVVLLSDGAERAERRRFNEAMLETERPVHHLADGFLAIIAEEAGALLAAARAQGALNWDVFAAGWARAMQRIVLGESAREEAALTDLLARLRRHANWAYVGLPSGALRARFHARLRDYIARAEPGSLAGLIAASHPDMGIAPTHQMAQWLFAFDGAIMGSFRALALLAAHPEAAARACAEARATEPRQRRDLPFLRAAFLDALRLWPTTPLILRETVRETDWRNGRLPAGAGIVIYAPFFHRDSGRLPFADRFTPELWLGERQSEETVLIPFSGGPAICPGHHLVPLLAAAMLASIMVAGPIALLPPDRLRPERPLPGTLDHFSLTFRLSR
jgi:cytochrome P450